MKKIKINLKDIKNKEIKEGDILKSVSFGGGKQGRKIHYLYHSVVWNSKWNKWFLASAKWDKKRQDGDGCCPLSYYDDKIKALKVEIIGNIKEMPHFLEEQHQKIVEENTKLFSHSLYMQN
jgi:hypothetical protein